MDQNELKKAVVEVHIDKELEEYIVNLIFATREPEKYGLEEIKDYIQFGASPRATIDMFKASKAKAFIRGNDFVTPIDIALVFKDIVFRGIIFAPTRLDFWTYMRLCDLSQWMNNDDSLCITQINYTLFSPSVTAQFTQYFMVSFIAGIVVVLVRV